MEKIYAVAVKRTMTDYILIHADSEKDAMQRANLLITDSEPTITLGDDGEEREEISAEESTTTNPREIEDLAANDAAWVELLAQDNASI